MSAQKRRSGQARRGIKHASAAALKVYSKQHETALARADWENGCDPCWDALRRDLASFGLPDPADTDPAGTGTFRVPAAWVGRLCPHGAGPHANTILLPADEASS